MNITRDNHYVPIWYQKRFLSSKQSSFYYLNLSPDEKVLPDGRKVQMNAIHWPFSPSQCFYQKDLYTTHYNGFLNDEIERYLFGGIDGTGSRAVGAMADQEFNRLHENFLNFFEYIDIQKIRTPKGLDWIRSKFPRITHNELLLEMQRIRRIHCTLWTESVREIVDARNSKVKFVISDHPITIYNPACPPSSYECEYPNDPKIEMKATQTIFPLDSNRCLILTNLDYARDPNLRDPKAYRPNANPFRNTLIRTDNTICKREISDEEVAMINQIIKLRTKRFLASEEKEHLYPEKCVKLPWADLGKPLLPPEDKLYHYGGETYVGYKDGTSSYSDEYGRTRHEADYLRKPLRKGKVGPNEPCICGSGKKYKKCCRDKPADERTSSSVLSIRERNIKFSYMVTRILNLDEDSDWDDIRRELTDKKIADIHKAVAVLWPPDTDLMSLLPRPDSNVLRALYTGFLDPRVIYKNVTAFSLFADEILVESPFMNANIIQKEFNPIANPEQYRQETLKNLFFLIQLMPLIQSGHVNLFPDPCIFNSALRKHVMAEAEKRRDKVQLDEKSRAAMEALSKEDFMRSVWTLPADHLKAYFKRETPDITDEDLKNVLEYMKKKNEQDPLAPLQPMSLGKSGAQMIVSHLSPNLEMSMFLAQATGSFIYTDHPYRWSEICSSISYFYGTDRTPWMPIVEYITNLDIDLIHFIDRKDLVDAQKNGELHYMRKALRNVWNAVQGEQPSNQSQIDNLIKEISAAREKMVITREKIMKQRHSDKSSQEYLRPVATKGKLSCKIAPTGHGTNAVYRFLLAHAGHEKYMKTLPMSLFLEHVN